MEIQKKGFPISKNRESLEYGWEDNGTDAHLHIGIIRKAAMVMGYLTDAGEIKYYISSASYFPFTIEMYKVRYAEKQNAINDVNKYLADFFTQTFKAIINE